MTPEQQELVLWALEQCAFYAVVPTMLVSFVLGYRVVVR